MATLAGPSSSCCIKTVSHTGTARGTIEPLGGIDTYISTPPQAAVQGNARKIVLWFPDIYGAFFLNSQLIMDWFAEQGYLIVAPDYFFGDPVTKHLATPGFSILEVNPQ